MLLNKMFYFTSKDKTDYHKKSSGKSIKLYALCISVSQSVYKKCCCSICSIYLRIATTMKCLLLLNILKWLCINLSSLDIAAYYSHKVVEGQCVGKTETTDFPKLQPVRDHSHLGGIFLGTVWCNLLPSFHQSILIFLLL